MGKRILQNAKELDSKRYTPGKTYRLVGSIVGTNCVIVEADDKGERTAICEWRFGPEVA